MLLKTQLPNVRYNRRRNLHKIIYFFYFNRTLWVRSINNAIEECRRLEETITNDRALFSTTGQIVIKKLFCEFLRFIFLGNEHRSGSAVARLNLLVHEAYILPSSTTGSSRHRSYCFHYSKTNELLFLSRCSQSLL